MKKKRIAKRLLSLMLALSMVLPGMPYDTVLSAGQVHATEEVGLSADQDKQDLPDSSEEAVNPADGTEDTKEEETVPEKTRSDFVPGVISKDSELYIAPEDKEKALAGVNGVPGLSKPGGRDKTYTRLAEEQDTGEVSERIEETRPENNQVVDFIVVLDREPLLDKFTPDRIRRNDEEVKAYQEELDRLIETVKQELSASFGSEEGFGFGYSHTISTVAVSVSTRYGNRQAIEAMEEVASVYVPPTFTVGGRDTSVQPFTSNSPGMIGATDLNESGYSGKGMKIAIIDTGLKTDHPNFRAMEDDKITDASMTEEDVVNVWSHLNAGKDSSDLRKELAYKSNKLPFVFNYYNRSFDVGHQTAGNDHGTHVAGIAAANKIPESEVVGIAPDAQLIIMQVFSPNGGAEWSTIIAALEDAILLGVDTANFSLGSPAGFTDGDKEMNEVLSRLEGTETSILIAGGNDTNNAYFNLLGTDMSKSKNVDNGLLGTPASAPGAISVASADNDGAVLPYVEVNGHKIGFTDTAINSSTNFLSRLNGQEKEYVIVPGIGDASDYNDLDVDGKIAVVERGTTTFQEKQQTAQDNGAVAVIIYNNTGGTFAMQIHDGDGHIPAVSITKADGEKLKEYASTKPSMLKVCSFGDTVKVNVDRTMSSFSSWGSTPDLKIKPEITGVGGNILSTRDPKYGGSNYGNMSGTSMATPQVTGAFAVLQQYLKSKYNLSGNNLRLVAANMAMSTASQLEEGESLYSVRNQGAGLVDLNKATSAGAYLSVPASFESRPKAEIGDDHTGEGKYSFEFSITNMDEKEKIYTFDDFVMTADIDSTGLYMANTTRELTAKVVVSREDDVVDEVTIPAGQTVSLLAEITLTEEDKKFIDDNFPYGNYVEGYLYARDKAADGVTLSLPFLGFYGDWSDNPVFDDEGEEAQLQAPVLKTKKGRIGNNPYITGGKAGDKYNAVSIANPLEQMTFGLMRNARRIHQRVTSRDGNTEYFSWGEDYMIKTHYNANYGRILPYDILNDPEYGIYIWQGTDKSGNQLPNGTQVTYTFSTYLDDGDDKVDDVYTFDLTIDNEAPVIQNKDNLETAIIKDYDKGTVTLPLTITENQYIAAVMFEDIDGRILGRFAVNNEPGETVELTYDVTGYGTDFKVIVGDYAANETEVDLSIDVSDMPVVSADPIALKEDRIYGYETYTDGYVNMGWFSANKKDFSNLRNETYAEYDSVINAGEYINGYVIGQRYNDGALVVFTPYSSYWNQNVIWEQTGKGTTSENPGAIVFYDMAMDYTTGTLYASGWEYKGDGDGNSLDDGYNALFKINLGNTVTVTEVVRIEGMTNSLNAMTLACDGEGQLYTITSEAKLYKLNKNNGEMTFVGQTSFNTVQNYAGVNVIQSMAYDHNTGDTYWYAHSQALVANAYINIGGMYRVNLETAEITPVGGSGNSGYTSLFIPSDKKAENIKFKAEPTGLQITPNHIKLVKGQSARMNVKWQPWNAVPVAINWSTDDRNVATVNNNGKVTAVNTGTTDLVATVEINGVMQTFRSTIEVVKSAEAMYGFVIVDHNGKVPESSWITYADSNMEEITKIPGPGGMIQGGTYYEGYVYFVECETIPFGPKNTKFYRAKVNPGSTNQETTIGSAELINTIENVELGNLGFDYNTGRLYAVDYTFGGLALVDIDSGEYDFLGEFKGDIGGPVIMPAMCVTANGNIIGSDMFGDLYQVNPDTMQTQKIAGIGEDSWFYAGMTYDYNTGNIYWNPCMGEGLSDLYMMIFDDTKNGLVTGVELVNLGGLAGRRGTEQTVLFTIPGDEPETHYITATSIEITNGDITYVAGGTMQLYTQTVPVRPTVRPRKWSSSNEAVAKVNAKGLLSFVGPGEATITVTVENKGENPSPASVSDSIKVTVYENAGEFMAFLAYDEMGTNYFDFWITMKDYEITKSEVGQSMINTYSLRAGAYYDGYIYAFNDKEEFYKINADNHNDFTVSSEMKVTDPKSRVISMAMDYNEGIMYGVTLDKKLVTIDINNGAMKEKAELKRKIDAIAIDDVGIIYGVGSEQIYENSNLYIIDAQNGECEVIKDLGGVVFTGDNYSYERMYSPQMAYDFGTNRLYLNATIRHRTLKSSNRGFFMIQLSKAVDTGETIEPGPDMPEPEDPEPTPSDNDSASGNTSGNDSASGNTSGNTSGNGIVKADGKEVYGGRTSFTGRIFDAVKNFLRITKAQDDEVLTQAENETEEPKTRMTKTVEFVTNLGKPGLEILSPGKDLGEVYLGLLVSIPEEGEIKPKKVTGIRLDRESATVEVDSKITLKAEIIPSNLSEEVSRDITWKSSDEKIATVDPKTGEITGVKEGDVTITATSESNKSVMAVAKVKVVAKREGNISKAYTVSAKKDKLLSFDPEVPSKTVTEIATIYGGGNIAGIAQKDEDTFYYVVANPSEAPYPVLHTYNIKTGQSQRIAMLNTHGPDASDIAYDRENDLLYVVNGYYVFQFVAGGITTGEGVANFAQRLYMAERSDIYGEYTLHGVTLIEDEVYFLGSDNTTYLFKVDDKFNNLEKIGAIGVNTVRDKCEIAYDPSVDKFYITDASDKLYSFDIKGTGSESKIQNLRMIDILDGGLDINGLCIIPGKDE